MRKIASDSDANVGVIHELPLQTLPSRWAWEVIDDIADVNPRIDKSIIPDDLMVSFVPMPAVGAGNGSIDVNQKKSFSEVKKGFTPFKEGDVLFAKITPCMENGKMAVVPKVSNGYGFGSTEFHVLRPKEGIDAHYIYYYVSSKTFRGEAERYMTGAVGQKRVSTTYLKESKIPVASPPEQKLIVAEIEKQFSRLDEAVAALKRIKANLKRYKASVLKAAVEGKLTSIDKEGQYFHKDKWQSIDDVIESIDQGWSPRCERLQRFSNLMIPLPPLKVQIQIDSEVERLMSISEGIVKELEINIHRAESLRQSILKKAFSGKLVSQEASKRKGNS